MQGGNDIAFQQLLEQNPLPVFGQILDFLRQLRIDGYLRLSSGETLEFARYKRMKKTLQTIDGELLEDKVLLPYLQGVSQELFENLFGIDHHALVQGGKDILEQKGDTGQALFSASIGSQSIHTVTDKLEEEANALFLPSGQIPVINKKIQESVELLPGVTGC